MDIFSVESFFRGVMIACAVLAVLIGGMFGFKIVKMPKHSAHARSTPVPLPVNFEAYAPSDQRAAASTPVSSSSFSWSNVHNSGGQQ